MSSSIQHVFVLILENRSFDHMLGFSGIKGTDASSGDPTEITGLIDIDLRQFARPLHARSARQVIEDLWRWWPLQRPSSLRQALTSNGFNGQLFAAREPADFTMAVGPGHEFSDVLMQLTGTESYAPGSVYPPLNNSGYVANYVANGGGVDPGEVMKCFDSQAQLPVLTRLAQEFVICDNWFSSLPGPTWPNRFFAHAASSGGLDHSPTMGEMLQWETIDGFDFPNGTIFDKMNDRGITWRIYAGDNFPIVAALKGIQLTDINDYQDFLNDVAQPGYPVSYTFIEPNYGHMWSDYKCGTSQHPLDDVTRGEALIKSAYEAIRDSPCWGSSLLIITYDEHGGFFDHALPPSAVPPGDTETGAEMNQYGFTFEQLGPRVPAIVISPLIPRNLIDHRIYDHSSIPATLETCFGVSSLTRRDSNANELMSLVTLSSPRNDAPTTLPPPASSGVRGCSPVSFSSHQGMIQALDAPLPVVRSHGSVNGENIPGFLQIARRFDVDLSSRRDGRKIAAQLESIKTRGQAIRYLIKVYKKLKIARTKKR